MENGQKNAAYLSFGVFRFISDHPPVNSTMTVLVW